jgi:hypothetical protein
VYQYGRTPAFAESSDYRDFWAEFRQSEYQDLLNADLAQRWFWHLYLLKCPKKFVDLMKLHYALEGPGDYGTADVSPVIDLVAGMRLRIEAAAWQQITANPQSPDRVFNGYVPTVRTYLTVTQQTLAGNSWLTFNPWLGHLGRYMQAPKVDDPQLQASGAIDLHSQVADRRAYYRLVYPTDFVPSNPTTAGRNPVNHVFLVGGNSRESLTAPKIRAALNQLEFGSGAAEDPDNLGRKFTTIRGRSWVVPQVMIQLDNGFTYIDVGATLGDVVQQRAELSDIRGGHYRLYRRHRDRHVRVEFQGDEEALFQIPLVKGDRIAW